MRTFFGSKLLHMVCMCLATLSASGSSMGDELIGLVLAGGGARGLAHIGVINALEDLQVPVHAVTGTSMGALVGGFYATGMTGGELQELVASMDWGRAFRDTKDRPYLPQRRKSEDYDYPSKTRLEFADGSLSLPLGLLEGQQAQVMIKSKLQGAESVDDFDLLPRKFRAVATDISTGKPVVLRRGDLGTAMRASMSIPGLLAPVEIDGQLLVDGGASMNIPVLPAQSIEVDRLIVVDIGSHLMNLGEIGGMVAVAEQLVKLMTRRNSLEQLELMGTEDILVSPDVEHISALDFDKADELIDLGYVATMNLADKLQDFRLSDEAWASYIKQVAPSNSEEPIIEFLDLENRSLVADHVIIDRISQPIGGHLAPSRLTQDIADTYALGHWRTIDYELISDERGTGLLIKADAAQREKGSLKFGLSLQTEVNEQTDFGVYASFLKPDLNELGGELYVGAEVGDRLGLAIEYYQPLDHAGRYFLKPYIGYSEREVVSLGVEYDFGETFGDWRVKRRWGEVSSGVNLWSNTQFMVGLFGSSGRFDITRTASDNLEEGSFDEGGWVLSLNYDTLNNFYFPTRGAYLKTSYQRLVDSLGSDAEFERLSLLGQAAWSFGVSKRHSLLFTGRMFVSEDAPLEPQNLYQLGGLFNLSGLPHNALSGRQSVFLMTQYQWRLTDASVLPFASPVYLGASFEGGKLWRDRDDINLGDLFYAGSIYVGMDTPIGPVYLAYGRTEDSVDALYLALSWPFLTENMRMGR